MTKSQICITIPIYKETLNEFEVKSVRQCINVLIEYDIFFVCSNTLNTKFYKEQFSEIKNYKTFNNHYFANLKGYNSLLLSTSYYLKFENYKYMLVYQTDCYVFKEELLIWAQKGYDYIGSVVFNNFLKNPEDGADFWCAGNGGFSLRNISAFLKVLKSTKKLKNKQQLALERKALGVVTGFKAFKHDILFILKRFGYKNNVSFYASQYDNNEDVFFINLSITYNLLTMPEVEEALLFSWDRRPDFLFHKLNKLPFGCHAWYREDAPYFENKTFWTKHIK